MIRKFVLNFGLRAIPIIGPYSYFKYFNKLVHHFPEVIRTRKLLALDKEMNGVYRICHLGKRFFIDCGFANKIVEDGSYAFGGIKEIYIRNCYLGPIKKKINFSEIKTVVDLGGNRGLFTVLAAKIAEKVIYVEADNRFEPVIKHHCVLNDLTNVITYFAFIGAGGACVGHSSESNKITLEQIMQENNIELIGLLKMDIEGSEFALIRDFNKFANVRAIVMEIHPEFGEVSEVVNILEKNGFILTLCDENLSRVCGNDLQKVNFVYAIRN